MCLTLVWSLVTWTEQHPGRDVYLAGENIALAYPKEIRASHLGVLSYLYARHSCRESTTLSRVIHGLQRKCRPRRICVYEF